MSKTYDIDQMKLFADVTAALAKQHPDIPADERANAVIYACNHICAVYGQNSAESVKPTYEELEAKVADLTTFKASLLQALGMGCEAEHFAIFENINNMRRFSDTLHALERSYFTKHVIDEQSEGETFSVCPLLWGMTVEQYVAEFAKCLNEVRAESIEQGIQTITSLLNHQAPGVSASLVTLKTMASELRKGASA